jgi:hypothetical protein
MLGLSNMARLEKNAWKDDCEYEAQLNRSIMGQPMAVLHHERRRGAPGRRAQPPVRDRHAAGELASHRSQLTRAGSQPWRR